MTTYVLVPGPGWAGGLAPGHRRLREQATRSTR
jgi:hypothetical protein